MRRIFGGIAVAGAALLISACVYDPYYRDREGYGGRGYDGPASYDDAYYDGYYGPYAGGYWGPDGYFYYSDSGHGYHRDDNRHFRRDHFGESERVRAERHSDRDSDRRDDHRYDRGDDRRD